MKYRNIETNEIVYIHKLRQLFPNISIPDYSDLTSLGYKLIVETEPPVKEGFYAVEVDPVNDVQTWELIPVMETPKLVPLSITARQLRLQLLKDEKLDSVIALLDDQDPNVERSIKIEFEYATEFNRDNVLINALAPLLDLTSDDIDDIFIKAAML